MRIDEIMNSREKKRLFLKIEEQWGIKPDFLKEYAFIKKQSGKIFISTKEAAETFQDINVRKYSLGNYFGKITEKDNFRLSIEGSGLLGPNATRNVLELDRGMTLLWLAGHDLEIKTQMQGFLIIKSDEDYIGCGQATENKILNYVPKNRRIKNLI